VPVVASASGAFPELLGIEESSPAGEVHVPGDILDLTRCIEKVLHDATLAAELGLAGHTRVSQRYQSHHMAAAHESLYEALQK
jgi:glycosyltransferase involved in cell wall biosynthesis